MRAAADSPHSSTPSAAVLIVSYNGRTLLADCLQTLFASPDAPPAELVVVVDNDSSDDTCAFLTEQYPTVQLIRSATNLGFAGGNNLGFRWIRQHLPQVQYVALLNQDTLVNAGWLAELVHLAGQHPEAGSVQSKLLFHPETTLFNSAGNRSHFLGFGFVSAYREQDLHQHDTLRELAFCSGAAMLVRVSAIDRDDLFDDTYFAYLEDAELGWYIRLRGLTNLFCPGSVVYHRYQFRRNAQMFYRLERNRWRLLLSYYRWRTLLLLLPMLLIMEGGLLFYFLKAGALKLKFRSWDILGELPSILRFRRQIQAQRKLTDRDFTAPFIAHVDFPEVRNPLLTYLGNPMLRLYWWVARCVLRW